MKRSESVLLSFAGAVMEFTWLFAWAAFSTMSIAQRYIPLPEAAAIFLAGAVITGLSTGRGLRVISIVLLQAAGIAYATFRAIYIFNDVASPFISHRWIVEFFGASHSAMGWLLFVVSVFWAMAFWAGGARFAVRPKDHEKICSRFDLGLAAFLCLFLLKFALKVKGNISISDPLTGPLACTFFFFGLASIGMTRGRAAAAFDLIAGYRRFGVVLGFILAVFASVVSVVVFFQQPLANAARAGYGLIKGGASYLGIIFVSLIRFIYLPKQTKAGSQPAGPQGGMLDRIVPADTPAWMEVVLKVLGWLLGTVFGLIVLAVFAFAAFYFIKWLFSRTKAGRVDQERGSFLVRAIRRLWAILALLASKARRALKGYRTAADYYIALTQWSRRSGIRRRLNETPSEFCSRLTKRFPALEQEIGTIVAAFNREFYGDIALGSGEIAAAQLAWRKLRNPVRWLQRLRAFFSANTDPVP
ncbi:MAG TPA: DUF4129 domain-containing protein [Syntrophorhabdaceae bacterium]|nr:DUF4129 domain-containing protein [Syntrophorhabdaceae bacterium]HQM82525.1 DUF4129 domain-containing protein [Syntrophorhabdaceae bacterium]